MSKRKVLFSISLGLSLFTANQEQSSRKESEKQAALALFHFCVICFSFLFTSNSPSVILPWAQWQTHWLHHQHETWVLLHRSESIRLNVCERDVLVSCLFPKSCSEGVSFTHGWVSMATRTEPIRTQGHHVLHTRKKPAGNTYASVLTLTQHLCVCSAALPPWPSLSFWSPLFLNLKSLFK